jgi:signal peptidase II
LLLAGAAGNLIDRLAYGYVVDFLDLGWFPVFNLADAAVVVGAALLAAGTLLSPRRKPDSEHHEPS